MEMYLKLYTIGNVFIKNTQNSIGICSLDTAI